MTYLWIVLTWLCVAVAVTVFKHGGDHESRRIICLIIGNLFGITGTWFVMLSYKTLSPNLVLALYMGGGFICSQIALSLYTKANPTLPQYLAIALIAAGILIYSLTTRLPTT